MVLKDIFEQRIVFNRVLGLRIGEVSADRVTGSIQMREDLIGHYGHQRLHGGVISAGLDAMGGLAVMAAIGARHMDEPPLQRLHRFGKLGTIDLRIDLPAACHRRALRTECTGAAAGLARGLHAHGVQRRRRQAACHRRRGLHRS